ncbi:MAG: ring,2-phenylacetyl-CoA epoxidase subunit PaaE [Pseudonocardiales bacterium]|nr:ring,2-phenylacetyl-CoA epoxidase subunit PaaE [Pseudonocardiales bacterium]
MPDFLLPDLGEGLTEAEIVGWHVQIGDRVEIDQIVVEVETAKAAVEVPIPFAGVVDVLHAQPGETVAVGAPLISVTARPKRAPDEGFGDPARMCLVHVLSREPQEVELFSGRLDAAKLRELLPAFLDVPAVDHWWLCGPFGMVTDAMDVLTSAGVAAGRIHRELFYVGDDPPVQATSAPMPRGASAGFALRLQGWSLRHLSRAGHPRPGPYAAQLRPGAGRGGSRLCPDLPVVAGNRHRHRRLRLMMPALQRRVTRG